MHLAGGKRQAVARALQRHFLPDNALGAVTNSCPKNQLPFPRIKQCQPGASRADHMHGALQQRLEQRVLIQRGRQRQIRHHGISARVGQKAGRFRLEAGLGSFFPQLGDLYGKEAQLSLHLPQRQRDVHRRAKSITNRKMVARLT